MKDRVNMDEVYLRVEPQGQMPVINVPMKLESPLSGKSYVFVPKRITAVRWHPDGSVIVDVKGNKQPWNEGSGE